MSLGHLPICGLIKYAVVMQYYYINIRRIQIIELGDFNMKYCTPQIFVNFTINYLQIIFIIIKFKLVII